MRVVALLGAIALTGCSATQEYNYQAQYCYTDQTITRQGENVDSKTVLECTDRPGQQTAIQRAGIDAGCREFWYPEMRHGSRVMVRGVACEKLNGSLEIVNINGNVR
jgi:hypothetical protein